MLRRAHYREIAAALNVGWQVAKICDNCTISGFKCAVEALSSYLAEDNPRFRLSTFLEAVYKEPKDETKSKISR